MQAPTPTVAILVAETSDACIERSIATAPVVATGRDCRLSVCVRPDGHDRAGHPSFASRTARASATERPLP